MFLRPSTGQFHRDPLFPQPVRRPGVKLDNSVAFCREYCQIIVDQFHYAHTIVGSPIQRLIFATVVQHGIGHPKPPIEASVANTDISIGNLIRGPSQCPCYLSLLHRLAFHNSLNRYATFS